MRVRADMMKLRRKAPNVTPITKGIGCDNTLDSALHLAPASALKDQLWRPTNPTNWPFCPCRPQHRMWLVLVEGRLLINSSFRLVDE